MKKVYIAGALNSDAVGYVNNMHTMIRCAEQVRREGFAVYVPCLDILMGLCSGQYTYKDYFDNSQPFLLACDAVFVCQNSEFSKGTQDEIKTAKDVGIPVFDDVRDLVLAFI